MKISSRVPGLLAICALLVAGTSDGFGQELISAYAFGSRDLACETPNDPGTNYTMVLHNNAANVGYDSARGFGFEVIYPENSPYGDRGGYGIYGPFDDSPNNRGAFGDDCPEQVYDSFIGAKNYLTECSEATEGSPDAVCSDVEGIIFRADVPNGQYQFVLAVGDADNPHAHRILAENGGSGPPENVGDHVVLIEQYDQAQQTGGTADPNEPGQGVFGAVGFADKAPPAAEGVVLADQGESPVLNVTDGYIRIHLLQANSNDGPGGPRDPNGSDIVLLELWRVGEGEPQEAPAMTFGGAIFMMAVVAALGAIVLLRRRVAPATARS